MTHLTPAIFTAISVVLATAGAGTAGPVTAKEAQDMLFSPSGAEVVMIPHAFLTAENAALLEQVASGYAYYAAVAVAPDEELLKSEATMLVANHHTGEAAAVAALAGCNAARTTDTACEVVAVVRPKRWKEQALQLSVQATQALKSDYGRKGPRAMAISPVTGFFGLGQGDGAAEAALAACTAKGAEDCVVAVQD